RAAQLRDVGRGSVRQRHLAPALGAPDLDACVRSTLEEPGHAPLPSGAGDHDQEKTWTVVPQEDAGTAADRAEQRRTTLADLPVSGEFSDDQTRALGDVDAAELDRLLRDLPVRGEFAPDDIVFLADTDLETLAVRMHDAPVDSRFAPEHAVIIASHLEVEEPAIPESLATPLSPEEYTSLVVHAAVEAEND